jgi:hypothetical protein
MIRKEEKITLTIIITTETEEVLRIEITNMVNMKNYF